MNLPVSSASLRASSVHDHLGRDGPFESDAAYFSRRAEEEKATAARSADALVRSLHLELAERYTGLSAAIQEAEERIG